MAKVTVCFCISTEKSFDMDMFTKKLGIIPTEVFKKNPSRPLRPNEWSLDIKKDDIEDVNGLSKEIIRTIYSKKDILKELKVKYNFLDYVLVFYVNSYYRKKAKMIIDSDIMNFVKELDCELIINEAF